MLYLLVALRLSALFKFCVQARVKCALILCTVVMYLLFAMALSALFKFCVEASVQCALILCTVVCHDVSSSLVSTWLQHAMPWLCSVQLLAVSRQPSQIWDLRKDANVASFGKFSTALLSWLNTYYWYIYNSYAMESKLNHQFILLQVRGISSMALLSLLEKGTVHEQFDFIELWLNRDWVMWKIFKDSFESMREKGTL